MAALGPAPSAMPRVDGAASPSIVVAERPSRLRRSIVVLPVALLPALIASSEGALSHAFEARQKWRASQDDGIIVARPARRAQWRRRFRGGAASGGDVPCSGASLSMRSNAV